MASPAVGTSTPRLADYPTRPPTRLLEWVMLLLAIVSVALLTWVTFWDVPADVEREVILADYVICGIFALEFGWRWWRQRGGWRFPVRYWYEVIGMIPLSDPAFRAFRLLRIVVVLARLGRAADRAFGERITAAFVKHFTDTIVGVIKKPVTIAVMDEVIDVLRTGTYTRNMAVAIEQNRPDLEAMIVAKVLEDPAIDRLRLLPFRDDVVNLIAHTSFRIVLEVLEDPRTDQLVSDTLRENVEQMREAVQGRDERDPDAGLPPLR